MVAAGWTIALLGLGYVALLFAIATWADRVSAKRNLARRPRPLLYSLSLAVYCTSWTYFGSVGIAAHSGFDFIPVYLGPILMFALGSPLVARIVTISKRQNVASIADFLAARYGKNQLLGGLVAIIAVIGIIPYISIQLKALSFSLQTMMTSAGGEGAAAVPAAGLTLGFDVALPVALALAAFAMLFGTRHVNATEHQDGMITAIAAESIVKLVAFLTIGVFVTYWLAGGPAALLAQVSQHGQVQAIFTQQPSGGRWLTLTLLSGLAILLLPRQFHVAVVENVHGSEVRRAAWMFPLYLIAINIFVLPIALTGLILLPGADPDTYVLALPVSAGNVPVALIAFVGGVSAATAMVIVETISLAIMISNNVVIPLLLLRMQRLEHDQGPGDFGSLLVIIRRIAICAIIALAYLYYAIAANSAALAQTGLISFAAVAQFAPAFFGGLMWRRGTAAGAIAGILAGFAVWSYTLLVPSFVDSGWISRELLSQGPFGISALKPRQLFGLEFEPLTHGVFWSLFFNVAAFAGISALRKPTRIEAVQAEAFIANSQPVVRTGIPRGWRSAVTFGQVEDMVARYLGRARSRDAFSAMAKARGLVDDRHIEADLSMLEFAEHLLGLAIGPSSARLIVGLLLERTSRTSRSAMLLLDEASAAVQYNRELLQSAIDNVPQGLAVFDAQDALICWNAQYKNLLGLPPEMAQAGTPIADVVTALLNRSGRTLLSPETIQSRIARLKTSQRRFRERLTDSNRVVEVHSGQIPGGGIVVTFTDVTDTVASADALAHANTVLEQRVDERTAELTTLNAQLTFAKGEAEAANIGKTRFIAAASHDILQPLNAARLFASTLVEREKAGAKIDLIRNLDASLEAVEDILSTVLDMSRLDAGAVTVDVTSFALNDLFNALAREFEPSAREKGLTFKVVTTSAIVTSDRKLLRRVLQNFLSNATKYTTRGGVLMGCRRRGGSIVIQIADTGPGIPANKQKLIFNEFERLDRHKTTAAGLGLGLAIVERLCRVMQHPITLKSRVNAGTIFAVTVPVGRSQDIPAPPSQQRKRYTTALEGLTVLAVDNEKSIILGLTELLKGWGVEVVSAGDAHGALSVASGSSASSGRAIDVILADYHIGEQNGLDLIRDIRRQTGREIPAILITADPSKPVQDAAAELSVSYLRKPLKPAALRAVLSQFANQKLAAE
jgi:Na+/proline symporter/signal transduction histidine kinase